MSVEERVLNLKNLITMAAVATGINITVYEGNIAFVDQKQMKIVGIWEPEYSAADIPGGH